MVAGSIVVSNLTGADFEFRSSAPNFFDEGQ